MEKYIPSFINFVNENKANNSIKCIVEIGNNIINITHKMIEDIYHIELNEDTGDFYIWSDNGYYTKDNIEFNDLEFAIKHTKSIIKNYFKDRSMPNPSGFKI